MATEKTQAQKDAERNAAIKEKAGYERQKKNHQATYDKNDAKIKRLRSAKKELKAIKTRLEERAKKQKNTAEDGDTYYEWSGKKFQDAYDMFAVTTPEEYEYYIKRVDIVLDAIVDAETTLENENLRLYGIIGQLGSWINSLASKIEKLWN